MATTHLSRLHQLRCWARTLATSLPLTVHTDAFMDRTHLDGPRYYCLFQVPDLGPEWQEAGEAETCDGALENLAAALLVAKCRAQRRRAEFFSTAAANSQNFSELQDSLPALALLDSYYQADQAAQFVYVHQCREGWPSQARACAQQTFRMRFFLPD